MLRILTALALLISVNFSYSQTTVETPIPNETPIEFKASDGSLDGTMIKRYSGNALRLRYAKNFLIFDALDDRPVIIKNSADQNKIQFHPAGDTYFMGGYVGIGTSSPSYTLHLLTGSNFDRSIGFSNSDIFLDSRSSLIYTANGSGTDIFSSAGNLLIQPRTSVPRGIYFNTYDGTSVNNRLSISSNGNIGIDNINPQEKLHVNGNIAISNWKFIKFYDNTNNDDGTGIIRGTGNSLRIKYNASNMFFDALSDQPIRVTNSQNENVIQLHPNGHSYFIGGSLSIGLTSSLGYQLAVNGTIGAKEVIVENTSAWPDYVFKPEYQLTSLDEVKKHIDEKGHLPNMPSAKEVNENGISLGEMNRLLLEKVEELTLYMLEQNTQLKAQQNQIQVLTEEIQNLKK